MLYFERKIQEILKDLKSLDSDVRHQAIRDLAVSKFEGKIRALKMLLDSEKDIQLKYEIRKSLNELMSLEKTSVSSGDDERLKNLKKAFESSDPALVNKAFFFAAKNRLEDFLAEMMIIETYTKDPLHRQQIVTLMGARPEKYFHWILPFLNDEDPRVISAAIEALEASKNTTALAALAKLTSHEHNRVQADAIKALCNLGDERASRFFIRMIQSEHSAYRDSAAYSLSKVRISDGVRLLSILLIDEVESVRIKALRGLEEMAQEGNQDALKIISRLKNENPFGLWPEDLVLKVSKLAKQESSEAQKPPSPQIMAALCSDAGELRMQAIQKLCEEDASEESATMIIERLKLEKDYKVIASGVLALGMARGNVNQKKNILIKYLVHHNDRVRANAIEALMMITDPRDRTFLVKSLSDTSNRVVGNAIVALWETLKKKTEKTLEDLVNSPHKLCQLTAVYCIGELADWKLAGNSRTLLKSKHFEVREKMREALEQLRDIPSFNKILEDYLASQKDLS